MPRLPQPGADKGNWGEILNDYLGQSHDAVGKLKADSVGADQLAPGVIAPVGLSGNYTDLTGAPTIPTTATQVNAEPVGLSTTTKATLDATIAAAIAASAVVSTGLLSGPAAVAASGDSITRGGQTDPKEGAAISWATLVGDYIGKPVFNPAVAGERIGDSAARFGAPITVTVPGGVIPANTTEFTVTLVSPAASNFIGSASGGPQSVFAGTFLGVAVSLRYTGTAWLMARLVAATIAKPVPVAGSAFRVDSARPHRGAVLVSFSGRNGGSITTQTRAQLELLDSPKRALLLAPIFSTAQPVNENPLISLAAEFGVQYYDLRSYMVLHGLDDEGVAHTAQDDIDIANDKIPGSFYLDGIHPTAAGQRAIARKITELLVEYGYVSASGTYIPERIIPLPSVTPTDPALRGLDLRTAGTTATLPSSTELQTAQNLDIMLHIVPTANVLLSQSVIRRGAVVSGATNVAWALQTLSNGRIRFQLFPNSDLTGAISWDSAATPPFPASGGYSMRLLVDVPTKTVSFYLGPDSAAFTDWTLADSHVISGTVPPIYLKDLPLEIQGPDGRVRAVKILSSGSPLVTADFTATNGAAGWTLLGGATVVGPLA